MGILNKFKKKKASDLEIPENTIEESLADKIQDDTVEMGIPQDLSPSKKNSNVNKVAMAGIGIVALGLIVSGLIAFSSGSGDTVAENTQPLDEIKNNQPKDFEQDKEELALKMPEQASEPEVMEMAQIPEQQAEAAPEQMAQSTDQKEPEETPEQRKMRGNVLVDFEGGRSAGEYTQTAEAQPVSFNDDGSGNSTLGDKLKPTATYQATAQKRIDSTYLLSKGTNIPCTLDTQIITTHAGFTRCLVTKDVYSANGRVLLLERGSKLVGEQTSALVQGQARVFVLWNEVETPNGVKVNIASTGAGQLGAAGHGARVNYHFFQRFGGAMLISLISDLSENLNNRNKGNDNITFENANDAAEEMATEALKNSINIPPTGYVNQGSLINVMVSRDVDFSKVYEVVTPYF
ncbi:type IV secretion system protein VirB10 [Neisseria sp. Ec49-e6-T10]|uniref:type IV secretion system protein VirB10 n=1 Tax=Neisseria sp. Ec49-e6-T10 TaxID=3140744 RepID=UPI003EC141DD